MSDFYALEETISTGIMAAVTQLLTSSLFSIAVYVMTALALYTIAKRRGLHKPWLAWIPVADQWLLGSLSDQYRYVTRGETKSKRKWLLGLEIAMVALVVAILAMAIFGIANTLVSAVNSFDEDAVLRAFTGPLITMLALMVPLAAVGIAQTIISYMALYDVYKSLDPSNCVMYLVLSIIFPITQPFFLLCNRNKDLGMPPRRPDPVASVPPASDFPPQQPAKDPWENPGQDQL